MEESESNVRERQTIEFPGALNYEQARMLMNYLAKEIPANINYRISQFRNFFHNYEDNVLREEEGTLSLEGMIRDTRIPMAFDSFSSFHDRDRTEMIVGMSFFRVPDWDISDYSEEVVKLWDDVREKVYEFFGEQGRD